MARVLIADDEPQILEVMVDVLEAAGHEVVGVPDGEQAFRQLQTRPFDVAVIDVVMPRLDGYHLAQKVHSLTPRPRMVIVTSRNFDGDRHALEAAGVDAFLQKPFANKDLIEVVANLVRRATSR